MLIGAGLALTGSLPALALSTLGLAALALRAEAASARRELPLLALAAVVFLAHTVVSGAPYARAAHGAALIALRMLALIYLLRWAARAFLGAAARWLLARPLPQRPRALLYALESARHALAMTPLAVREAEQQALALRARGLEPGGGPGRRARYLAAWLLPFLGTMLRLGESYGEALAARGYRPGTPRRSGLALKWGGLEAGALAGGAALSFWLVRGF